MGSPVTVYVPQAVEALLSSCHAQHLSGSQLTLKKASYYLLPTLHSLCKNLNPAAVLPPPSQETPHGCLTNQLLTRKADIGKTIMNAELSWFTDGSHLRKRETLPWVCDYNFFRGN